MIKVNYVVSNNLIKSVSIKGHAFYDTYGKDIVCAGISCITQTAVLGIKKLTNIKTNYVVDKNKGYLKLELTDIEDTQDFHDSQVMLNCMLCVIEDLYKQYPKYIKLEVKQ